MTQYEAVKSRLRSHPCRWLVTGVAGFIGSNLLETLLDLDQTVIGLDNFSTGHRGNIDEVRGLVSHSRWGRYSFIEGDTRDLATCRQACDGVDIVLHQAALGSVPRSMADPIATNGSNIDGFLNMLVAARDAGVSRFVYAASSSTYGDHPALPKVEDVIGRPLSPYAVTKYVNELYAEVFARCYGFKAIGLRYFNVFGRRQDPNGAYAAAIPKWFSAMLGGETVFINGDGETSRDFCYIDNCIQANILAGCTERPEALDQVYNIACGDRTTLNELFALIKTELQKQGYPVDGITSTYRDFRPGDVRHSLADIGKAKALLDYAPEYSVRDGLALAARWYTESLSRVFRSIAVP